MGHDREVARLRTPWAEAGLPHHPRSRPELHGAVHRRLGAHHRLRGVRSRRSDARRLAAERGQRAVRGTRARRSPPHAHRDVGFALRSHAAALPRVQGALARPGPGPRARFLSRAGAMAVSMPRPEAAGPWIWLFPATMALHVAEEAWTGETFPAWISRVAGVDLTLGEFLVFNALAFVVVVAATILARSQAWAVAALGTAMATNVA